MKTITYITTLIALIVLGLFLIFYIDQEITVNKYEKETKKLINDILTDEEYLKMNIKREEIYKQINSQY
jgi:uncharacterized membrane protein